MIRIKSKEVREIYYKMVGEEALTKRGVARKDYLEYLEACAYDLFVERKKGIFQVLKDRIVGGKQ